MKITQWWLLIVAIGCASCGEQTMVGPSGDTPGTTTSQASYLGLTPPTSEAVVFAPGVVSRPGRYDEPDGISDIYWISTEVIELEAPV